MNRLPARKLDKTDRGILRELMADSRRGFADIACDLSVSKNTVRNRFEELQKAGIVVGSTVQINYRKLGYGCVAAVLLAVDPSQVEDVSKYLEEIPDVFGPFHSVSRYNLRAVFALKEICELENIKQALRRKISVIEVSSNIWTDVWFLPENLSLIYPNKNDSGSMKPKTKAVADNKIIETDEIDVQLIRNQSVDSRVSFRKMAQKLGVSTDTAARRYERLKESGTIVPRIQINPTKIGYQGLALYHLRLAPECNSASIVEHVINMPDVVYVMKSTGDYNMGILLMVKDTEDILRVGHLIAKMPGIKNMETSIQRVEERWPLPRTYTSTVNNCEIAR